MERLGGPHPLFTEQMKKLRPRMGKGLCQHRTDVLFQSSKYSSSFLSSWSCLPPKSLVHSFMYTDLKKKRYNFPDIISLNSRITHRDNRNSIFKGYGMHTHNATQNDLRCQTKKFLRLIFILMYYETHIKVMIWWGWYTHEFVNIIA